ncbi:MAG: prefoldin subunit beta [Nanoarchaeota archaeon]|nr:prefoldin subunit beta [Nanoarchaeota archaeon]
MTAEMQKKIQELQMLEQNLQNFLIQKQNFQMQLVEVDSAIEELAKTDKAYKIVGNLMILSKKEDLEADLKNKREMAELRIKSIEKQEKSIKDRASKLQKEVLGQMEE